MATSRGAAPLRPALPAQAGTYKHPTKRGRVTIHGQPGEDVAPGTWLSILKQAGLREER